MTSDERDRQALVALALQMSAIRRALSDLQHHVQILTDAFRLIDFAELDRIAREGK